MRAVACPWRSLRIAGRTNGSAPTSFGVDLAKWLATEVTRGSTGTKGMLAGHGCKCLDAGLREPRQLRAGGQFLDPHPGGCRHLLPRNFQKVQDTGGGSALAVRRVDHPRALRSRLRAGNVVEEAAHPNLHDGGYASGVVARAAR